MKRGMASLLAVVLAVGLLPIMPSNVTTVHAAESNATTKTIAGIGTGIIADPTAPTSEYDAWTGSYVYFGTYDGNPVKYRVLDSNTTVFGGTTMLLDCDTILWGGSDLSSVFDEDSNNVWADSDIRTYLNETFLTGNFTTLEQSAIAESTKSAEDSSDGNGHTDLSYASLSRDKIFFLDAKEATNTSYGYSNTENSAANRKKTGGNAGWWLRSPVTFNPGYAGIVNSDGNIKDSDAAFYGVGVSPALNINLSSVLSTSVISGTAGATGAEYKLTILDDKLTINANGNPTRSGDIVSVPYTISGDNSGNATQVSILLTDKAYTESDAQILHYGVLDTSNDGTGTFTVPTDLSEKVCGTDYYAYIIAEEVNGTYETDYASTPLSITIPEKPWEAPTVKTINIGTPGIIDPAKPSSTSATWTGCYVYFGTYGTDYDGNPKPVKYRVLDSETSVFGGTTMLLDCDTILWAGSDPSNAFDDSSNVWADSNIRTYLNETFLTNNFSATEQSAIASSTKSEAYSGTDGADGNGWSSLNYAPLSNDKIFFLDAKEATNTSYGYSNTDSGATNRVKTDGNVYWWLRSAYADKGDLSGCVPSDGIISSYYVYDQYMGVSPALNINLSSVLFSSASETSKSSALTTDSSQIGTTNTTEWKLTLSDTGKTIKVTDNEVVSKATDGTITVPYTYTDTATEDEEKVNQISVMITDKAYTESDAAILYYGALQGVDISATTGTGTFVMPSGLDGKVLGTDYRVYILAEHTTGTNATDYASTPVEITDIYNEVSSVTISVDAPASEKALDTSATVLSDIKNAVVTWLNGNSEVTGNADYNTAYTVKVTLTAVDGYAFTDNTVVTLNGNTVTATKNADGTITVSYTFPVTEMGTVTHEASGFYGNYDGMAHGITVTVSDPADVTISYSTDGTNYSTDNPTFVDAGSYTVYYKIEKANYTTVTDSKSVAIAQKELTITAADQTITHGDSIDEKKYSVTGLVDGDSVNAVTLTPSTLELTDNGTITTSDVKITNRANEDVTGNYAITYVEGKLTIAHDTKLAPTQIEVTKTTTSYIAGQTLNVDDLTVTALYEDGYRGKVTSYTTNADSIDMNTAGDKTLTISYTENGGTVTKDISIAVSNGYAVTLPTEQIGYSITADTTEALWNGDVTLTFALADGYTKTDAFAVKVNGSEITLNNDGTYTISNVLKALTVTVEGVADVTAPNVKLQIKENSWTQLTDTTTFDIFLKELKDVTITAADVNSGSGMDKVYYYISNEALTEQEVKELAATAWAEYNGAFSINPDNIYVIYAKAVDKAGNVTYAGTDGMVLDTTAPVITGIEQDGVYYAEVTFGAADTYLDKVLVDDEEVTLTDGSYTIYADDKEHTIKATDKAGNEVSYTITVNYGEITYEATGYEGSYDGQAHGITVEVAAPSDVTISYSVDEGASKTYNSENPAYTEAGEYTVYYKLEKANYETVYGSKTVKLAKREISITANDQDIIWSEDISENGFTVTGDGIAEGDTLVVTLTPSTSALTEDGKITASDAKLTNSAGEDVTDNYDIDYATEGKLTITHNTALAPTKIEVGKKTLSYMVGETLNVDDLMVMAYYEDGYSEEVTGYVTDADSLDMNTAGEKILTVYYTENGTTVTKGIRLTVGLKTLTVTDADYTGVYDGQAHGITVQVADVKDADITYSTDRLTYSETNPKFADAGNYTVYYKVTKDNYNTVTGEATVTIMAKGLTITADNQTITKGEKPDGSKYTVTGLLAGDKLSSITLTPDTAEVTNNGVIQPSNAKIVNAAGEDVTANYNITYTEGKLVIEAEQKQPTQNVPAENVPTGGSEDTDTSSTTKEVETTKAEVPGTGDSSPVYLWLLLLIGSGLAAVGIWRTRKSMDRKS